MCTTRSSSCAITLNRFGLVFGILFVTVVPLIADLRARGMYTALERFKRAADDDVRELIHRLENLAAPPTD
ncbi:MAG: hypothetical protein ACYC6Y_30615 [Thermoguttaceae bacterium]